MNELFPGLNSVTGFLMIIAGFGFIIFVHELGHFLAAKMVGIKVTQFAIGFGPAILAWRKGIGFRTGSTENDLQSRLKKHLDQTYEKDRNRPATASHTEQAPATKQIDEACQALGLGETEYRLNWLPLGGYVKMVGQEDLDAAVKSDDERAFNRKPAWARAIVIVAGVTMNLIFGLIFFIIAFMHGVEFPPAIVGSVAPGSPASQAQLVGSNNPESIGLKAGDRVIRIDDTEVGDFMDLAVNTALAGADHTLTLQVLREGHEQPLSFKAKPVRDPVMGLLSLGIGQTLSPKIAATDTEELPQAWVQAGVQPGWFVTQAGGKAVGLEEFHKYTQAVIAGRGEPVPLVFADDINSASKTVETTLTAWPLLTPGDEAKGAMHLLGLEPVVMITALSPQGPAESAGVEPGDLLAELDGVDWPGIAKVPQIVKAAKGKAISIAVVRDGQRVELPAVKPNAKGFIGIVQSLALDDNLLGGSLPDTPFAALNLPEGSRILAIGQTPVQNYGDMQRALVEAMTLADAGQQPLSMDVKYQVNITGQPVYTRAITIDAPWRERIAQAGWTMPNNSLPFAILRQPVIAENAWAAAKLGVKKTHIFMMQTYLTLVRLIQQTVPFSSMTGPAGIVHAGTRIARESGWPYVLFFFGIISVNLVVINLLPIPIADGGLLLFLAIEKIKGSPVHPAILTGATYVGLAMIGGLFITVTYFDIMRMMAGN